MLLTSVRLAQNIWKHFIRQNCLQMATALSYQTLLALVPMLVLALALLTHIDAFKSFQENMILFVVNNFLPVMITQVHKLLQDLVLNAQNLTYVGLGGLAVTALLLLSSIEKIFAQIWQVRTTRNIFKRIASYILITLLGPIALATSLTLFTWLARLTEEASGLNLSFLAAYFTFFIPFGLCLLVLFLLYRLVPEKKIEGRHALIGAAFAAALFVVGKYFFKLYLFYFPNYQALYGALAILPLFLIWLYFSWAIVLLGATITAVLGFTPTERTPGKNASVEGEQVS
ncbi:MAG: YihY family inner membrane protein [Sneathiella sp.]|nr:YihY family inner membrane protein [Sneathiella sp.]